MEQQQLKRLTFSQRETARQLAGQKLVQRYAAKKPERRDYEFERYDPFKPFYWVGFFVFAAAFLISSSHILNLIGAQASEICSGDAFCFQAQRVGYLVLSELAMVLFLVFHNFRRYQLIETEGLENITLFRKLNRNVSVPLMLSLASAAFVLYANINSGAGLIESVLPPVFTLGLGIVLERYILDTATYVAEVNRRYSDALQRYIQITTNSPEDHPEFNNYLRLALWEALIKLKANESFIDAPPQFKRDVVQREIEAMHWTDGPVSEAPLEVEQPNFLV